MRYHLALAALTAGIALAGCNGGSPSRPTTTTTTTAPQSPFRIETLLTVYTRASELAEDTKGATSEERIGRILLGVDALAEGRTVFDNEARRDELQAAIDRIRAQFADADYVAAFDETRANLERFFNDADGDGWSIDGRSGVNRDWPYDSDGADPDGWTAQMVVTVTRR